MGYKLGATILVACICLDGCADVASAPARTESASVSQDDQLAKLATVTRERPSLSQIVKDPLPEHVAFARITIARNENPGGVPVYFDVLLYSSDQEPVRLGSFAPFPPDREDSYLLHLPVVPQRGDRLELRMSFTQQDRGEDVRIAFLPIELIDREGALGRR